MHSFPQFTHKFLWVGGGGGEAIIFGENFSRRQLSLEAIVQGAIVVPQFTAKTNSEKATCFLSVMPC